MSEERKKLLWPWIVALLIGPPVLYVGTYALMVRHGPIMYKGPLPGDPPKVISQPPCYSATLPFDGYILGNEHDWGRIFGPIHSIDRRLRPDYWTLRIEPQTL